MSKKYHILYEGFKTKDEYEEIPQLKGDHIVFKNIIGGKDFELNRMFFNGYQVENNVIFIK